MGNGFTGPPAVDFYSQLSGLGDILQKNRADQIKRDALSAAMTPGPDGTVDYGKAMLGLAGVDPQAASLMAQAQAHKDALVQHTADQAIAERHFQANYGLQKAAADRAAYEFEHTPDQLVPNPNAGKPGEPAYIDQYAQAAAGSANSKPIPFETLSGTKFLVRQPNGTNAIVDPNALAAAQSGQGGMFGGMGGKPVGWDSPGPQAAASSAGPQAAPAAPGTFSDRFSGAYPQTANANPAAPVTPVAGAPAAPAPDLTAVDPATGRREGWLKSQSPDVQAYIKKIADYEIDPRTTSIKGGHREQVLSAVAQYDPTYNQNEFGTRAKAMKDFSTGTQGNAIRSFDVATDHLETLKKYVVALNSGNIPAINALRNAYLQETGSALPTNVQAVGPIVGAEVSKAIIGSNNALADREELRKPLLGRGAPDQILGSIQAYQDLMAGQLKGLKKQYEDTTGKKNFDTRIRENTRKLLLGGESQGGADAASSQPNVTSTGIKWSIQ